MRFLLSFVIMLGTALSLPASGPLLQLYVAPAAIGTGSGASSASAADIRDAGFWKRVNAELQKTPVTVHVLPGEYIITHDRNNPKATNNITLTQVGDPQNRLTIRGADRNATCFKRNDSDSMEIHVKNFVNLITLRSCRNIRIEKLYFTGKGICGYALQIRGSQDITVSNCHWKNMSGISYGASGANGRVTGGLPSTKCSDITWENCIFDTVGYDSHAHMLYNANDCRNLTVRNCVMIDSTGDYIRFRNGGGNFLIENCSLTDTGKYQKIAPFISVPIFVYTQDPARQEHFANNIIIRNNTFKFTKPGPRNWLLLFHISGYNPVGKEYFFSATDAADFAALAPADARAFFLRRTGIDLTGVQLQNNTISGHKDTAVYECWPNYGSESTFQKTLSSLTRLLVPVRK
ncbi:MAG: hypothetical protein IJC73_09020 [Lentisphaeria bacterium]|nr:hypothetical protein [Lentisphaeria bacterium]